MIRRLKTKDEINFVFFCNMKDKFKDFYITKDNQRLFLNDHKVCRRVFNDCLKRGDQCLIKEEKDTIKGLLMVNGYADKFSRKYMKVYTHNNEMSDHLIRSITQDFPSDLYIKVKNNNPITEVLIGTRVYNLIFKQNSKSDFFGYGFRLLGRRGYQGKELLLCRKYNKKYDYSKKPKYVKEGDQEWE